MISTDKEACISDVVCHQEGDDVRFWNLRFYRDFAASFSLLDFIQAHLPRGLGSDSLCWVFMEMVSLIPVPFTMS